MTGHTGATCDTCGGTATTTRTEGGSTPTYRLCDGCAAQFDNGLSADECVCGHSPDDHDLRDASLPCLIDGCPCRVMEVIYS